MRLLKEILVKDILNVGKMRVYNNSNNNKNNRRIAGIDQGVTKSSVAIITGGGWFCCNQ